MGIWKREDEAYGALPADRQANVDIVYGAYRSVYADKAYLTMPITSGARLYDVLDRYDAPDATELEREHPGVLVAEVIEPNLASGRDFAERVLGQARHPLIVPGVFEARKQRWTQEEYMILWLRVITDSVKELYLPGDWAYSSGGVQEFVRAIMLQFRFVEGREDRPVICQVDGRLVDISAGASELTRVIQDLERRGYQAEQQRRSLAELGGIAIYLTSHGLSREEYSYHTDCRPWDSQGILGACRSVGLKRLDVPGLISMGSDMRYSLL